MGTSSTARRAMPGAAAIGVRLLPFVVLAVVAVLLVVAAPGDHYGLLLSVVPFLAAAVHGAYVTALLGVAVVAVYGFLGLARQDDDTDVTLIKIAFLAAASATAVLFSQARARERTLNKAQDVALGLQRGLMPASLPGNHAVEVCHRYVPTDSEAGVGGDWCDVIRLSGARVALVVGDVVGHGVHAAATMGRLRTAVRTLADLDLPPDELLSRMDDLAAQLADEDETRDLGATLLYAVYDPVAGTCTLAGAGHPPPALLAPDGGLDFPQLPEHPPLGVGGTPFAATTLDITDGTVLALFTDGLLDLRHRTPDAALADIAAALRPATRPLADICDSVYRVAPPDGDDDITVLLARAHAVDTGHVIAWEFPTDPRSPAEARVAAGRQLAEWDLEEAAFATELVVTELVTNAVRYASGPIVLRLVMTDALICEVSDTSSTAPHMRLPRLLDEGGRGLYIVGRLAHRWGTRYTDAGKTIWVEQPLPPPPDRGDAAA
ncbi:ATP-binding SpoIIE family protein phosphatase [Streptomyces sp. NRRL F-5123]|uniref:ATP-binding SpoIIE family protein phosphatase n=1 Tax=Streptomyces sp. NRRL F-5123 TaxID=1463856 RepID=UPI0006938742|nr:ATP-binding SpoIIE family protein phosphatase [Streptomyces sp. NRRL F-5123]